MAKQTATKKQTEPKGKGKKGEPEIQIPTGEISPTPQVEPPAGISENATRVFHILNTNLTAISFDELSDRTDFSFDELNNALKELQETGVAQKLPELHFQIKPALPAEPQIEAGSPTEAEKPANGEATEESYDILSEVDGSKLKEAVAKVENQTNAEEAEKRIVKLPRPSKLPTMEEEGEIAELEEKALSHEDCAYTIKIAKQKQETLRAEMLEIMKKKTLQEYKHAGFVIKREAKGETVKIVSVQQKTED